MFYLFLVVMALVYIYLLLIRMPLYRYVDKNFDVPEMMRLYKWDDFGTKLVLSFLTVMWVLLIVDLLLGTHLVMGR